MALKIMFVVCAVIFMQGSLSSGAEKPLVYTKAKASTLADAHSGEYLGLTQAGDLIFRVGTKLMAYQPITKKARLLLDAPEVVSISQLTTVQSHLFIRLASSNDYSITQQGLNLISRPRGGSHCLSPSAKLTAEASSDGKVMIQDFSSTKTIAEVQLGNLPRDLTSAKTFCDFDESGNLYAFFSASSSILKWQRDSKKTIPIKMPKGFTDKRDYVLDLAVCGKNLGILTPSAVFIHDLKSDSNHVIKHDVAEDARICSSADGAYIACWIYPGTRSFPFRPRAKLLVLRVSEINRIQEGVIELPIGNYQPGIAILNDGTVIIRAESKLLIHQLTK